VWIGAAGRGGSAYVMFYINSLVFDNRLASEYFFMLFFYAIYS
jgi:hypothetical protein